ncbi:MAG: polysaccharide biosynthesis tyrosine autokinase [bacterium]|nr:polysaccharide biosynthesis tyrosine autokinase [bacterium]
MPPAGARRVRSENGMEARTRDEAEYGEDTTLREAWKLLLRRRSVAVSMIVVSVVVALVVTAFTTSTYRASTTIQIDRSGPDILTFKDVVGVDPSHAAYKDFYQTQYRILQSRTVLRLAAERLELMSQPEFASRQPAPLSQLASTVRGWFSSSVQSDENQDPLAPAIGFAQAGLFVEPVRNSHLVQVSFEDHDPVLARDMANAIADAYVQFTYESRSGTTAVATEFLANEVGRVQKEIEEFEQQLQKDSESRRILALSDGAQDISEQGLAALHQRYIQARGRLAVADARFRALHDAAPESLSEVLESSLINGLRQQYADLERRHALMSERFRDDWPELAQLSQELLQARRRLAMESTRIANQVRAVAEADLLHATAEVQTLEQQVDSQKGEVQRVNRDAIQVASLKAAIDTKRDVLADLIARQSQTETSDALKDTRAGNIRVVDRAETPQVPVRPNRKLNLAFGLLLGTTLGVGLAFMLDHLDNTIKSEKDIARIAKLPVLGHLPLVPPLAAVDKSRPVSAHVDLASLLDPRSHYAEACRSIRTALLLASPDHPPRSIVVTSCEPSDGKSTTAMNLAIVLTQLGRRVLIIDADLRRPRLHKALGLDNALGLSSLLSGNAADSEVIVETDIPNLSAIPSGPIPPNPSELLDSSRLKQLLVGMQDDGRFDHVLIDSPPLLHVTDTVLVSTHADATIIVVRGGRTRREALAGGARRLRVARTRVAGAVLNAVSTESGHYYYYGLYRSQLDSGAAGRQEKHSPTTGSRKRLRRSAGDR